MSEKDMEVKIIVNFLEAESRQSLNNGDDIGTLFGKISKFFFNQTVNQYKQLLPNKVTAQFLSQKFQCYFS